MPGSPLPDEAALLRHLATAITDRAVFALNAACDIVTWTESAERMLGYSDEVVGRPMDFLFSPEDRQAGQPQRGLEAARRDGHWQGDSWNLRQDGTRFWSKCIVSRLDSAAGTASGFVVVLQDRTEWKQAEEVRAEREQELRDSEARFRALMEQAPFSVQIFSPEGRTVRVNRAWEKLWGLRMEQMADYNVRHDPQLEAKGIAPYIERAFAGEAVAIPAIEYNPNETLPGRTQYEDPRRWVSAVAYPLKDAEGQVGEVVLIHQDTTAQKQAEDALRDAESRFRSIVSHSVAGVAEVDLEGRFLYANERYCQIVGRSLEELRQLRMIDISHPDDLPTNLPLFYTIGRDGTPYVIEKRYLRPDGALVWVHNSVSGLRGPDGQVRSVIAVCVDMTARRSAEQALREAHRGLERKIAERTAELSYANRFLRALLENLHEGIVACDAQGRLNLFNRAAAEFHATSCESIPAEEWADRYDLYYPDGVTRMEKHDIPLYRALLEEQVADVEMVIAPPNGRRRSLLASGQAFFDEDNNKLGAVVSMRDITERKVAEEALRRAHEQLEQRVAERTEELARLNAALQETDQRKNEFLAMLAHELRNPLAPIRSGLDLLGLMDTDDEIVQTMQQQVEHLVRLVDDLLDVSRIVRGRIELKCEPVELSSVIARAVETARPLIDAQRHRLVTQFPSEPVLLNADPVRLSQAISNLLNNAAKYTPSGGSIELAVEALAQSVVVRVTDTGIGIDTDLLPHVFDLFRQSERTIDRSQGGLGIGLTIVKSLVEMHGGTIAVASGGPGQGSEFTIHLPRSGDTAFGVARPAAVIGARPLRILIVDDNRAAAKMLQRLLGRFAQHDVRMAHDGPSALRAAREQRPQVILLDIGLPEMDGYEVARCLRSEALFDRTLIVALTGYGTEEDRRNSLRAGCDDHIIKPPGLDKLARVFSHPKLGG